MKDRQEYPNELFVRFMARNYYGAANRSQVRILDIGAGNGGNSFYLQREGFDVVPLDKDQDVATARMNNFVWADAADWPYPEDRFDAIADINTLCHVKDPPMRAIRNALKDGGKFFCIAPTNLTWKERVAQGKSYTRFCDKFEMSELVKDFDALSIRPTEYPDNHFQIRSWVVEASKPEMVRKMSIAELREPLDDNPPKYRRRRPPYGVGTGDLSDPQTGELHDIEWDNEPAQ